MAIGVCYSKATGLPQAWPHSQGANGCSERARGRYLASVCFPGLWACREAGQTKGGERGLELSEHRILHREGPRRREPLTALEAGRSEIQADAVATEGLASESHRGLYLCYSFPEDTGVDRTQV